MNKILFAVDGIKCAGCVSAIENALNSCTDVQQSTVSLENKQVMVETSSTEEQIASLLENTGYPARLLTISSN